VADYRLLPAGDTALVVEFGDRIDRGINDLVLALARRLDEANIAGILECVPTFRSLTIYYEPLELPHAALCARVRKLVQGLRVTRATGRLWRLPVCYDASFAPDLADVAERTGLTPAEVVERHSAVAYHVYMLGFLPGQPYLGDLPAELALPRRQTPRMKIAAGSVAIATTITSIFPQETPCGWHVIGRCPLPLWDRQYGGLLQAGDRVSCVPVSLCEYHELLSKAGDGRAGITPLDNVRDAAA
jgi:KipI family sensor histidine kinase inhibitor